MERVVLTHKWTNGCLGEVRDGDIMTPRRRTPYTEETQVGNLPEPPSSLLTSFPLRSHKEEVRETESVIETVVNTEETPKSRTTSPVNFESQRRLTGGGVPRL